jgi:DNA-binding HxlR family transcriptional regulator
MKDIIAHLNKAFESRIRLAVMSVLSVNESVTFNNMKELLEITDGNLASHLKALENLNYIISIKKFIGKKPNTSYQITKLGKHSFQEHIKALEALLK